MNYLLLKIPPGRLDEIGFDYQVLLKHRKFCIILIEGDIEGNEAVKKSLSFRHAGSMEEIIPNTLELIKEHKKSIYYIILNIIIIFLFFATLFYLIHSMDRDRALFLEKLYVSVLSRAEYDKKISGSLGDNADISQMSIVVSSGNTFYNAYYTGLGDIFFSPYIHGAQVPMKFRVLDSYRNILLFAEVSERPDNLMGLFEDTADMQIGQEVVIISHPYGLVDTKTSAVINGAYADMYGHLYYTSNASVSADMIGALVVSRDNKPCGVMLPVYQDFFSRQYKLGIYDLKFIEKVFKDSFQENEDLADDSH